MVARISEYVPVVHRVRNRLKIRIPPNRRVMRTDPISELGESVRFAGPRFRLKVESIAVSPRNLLGSAIAEATGRNCPFVRLRQGLRAWR